MLDANYNYLYMINKKYHFINDNYKILLYVKIINKCLSQYTNEFFKALEKCLAHKNYQKRRKVALKISFRKKVSDVKKEVASRRVFKWLFSIQGGIIGDFG